MKKNLTLLILLLVVIFAVNAQVSVITIDSARANDVNGVPLLNGVRVTLMGSAYAPEQQDYGHNFILNNGTAGIRVYTADGWHYTLTNGDSLVVSGVISQYGGEEEIDVYDSVATDTLYRVGIGHIDSPEIVTTIGEADESMLIEIQNIDMTTATGWTAGNKHYFNVTAGAFSLYIDSEINDAMFHAAQPQGMYNIIGFGSQYEYAAPYTSGYQLTPRSLADFIPVTTGINDVNNSLQASIYPNPNNGNFYIYLNDNTVTAADLSILDISGRLVYSAHQSTDGGRFTLNAQNLSSGIYMVEVRNGAEIFRNKIVVAK